MRRIVICGLPVSIIFFHAVRFSKKKIIKHNVCFNFNLSETFLILRRTQRDMIEEDYKSSRKLPVILVRFLIKLEFSQQIFEKYSNIKFHENPSSANPVIACRRTDRHDEANS